MNETKEKRLSEQTAQEPESGHVIRAVVGTIPANFQRRNRSGSTRANPRLISAKKMAAEHSLKRQDYAKKQIPTICRGLYQKTITGKASYREAIKAHCQHCFGYTDKYRELISGCTSKICPLWNYRPYQRKRKDQIDEPKND